MQRNSVISLRSGAGAWQRIPAAILADPHAAYGCVDWFLYQDASSGARASSHDPPASLKERAAMAAGATLASGAAEAGTSRRSAG